MWASMVLVGLLGGADASASEHRQLMKQARVLRDECDALADEECTDDCRERAMDRCMDLADMTRQGQGLDADKGGAAALYRQGCDVDRARGCVGLAELIIVGEVDGDVVESVEILRATCAQWDGSHDSLLGQHYLEAQAVAMACLDRGHIYRRQNKSSRAMQLYRKACAWDSLGCFSAAAIMSADKEALAKTLTARACGMEEAAAAPTQVVGRAEMERGCHSLRTDGVLPDDLGAAPKSTPAIDMRLGEKVPTVDFGESVQVKKTGVIKPSKAQLEGPLVQGSCRLHLVVDAKGKPYDVRVSACGPEAASLVEGAGWRWRFEPVLVEGVATRAQFEFDMEVSVGTEGAPAVVAPEAAPEETSAETSDAPAEDSEPSETPAEEAPAGDPAGASESAEPAEEAPTSEESAPVEEAAEEGAESGD